MATRQGIFRTQVVEVPTPAADAGRIASLEALSLSLPKGSTVEELDPRLDDIGQRGALYQRRRRWALFTYAICYQSMPNGSQM